MNISDPLRESYFTKIDNYNAPSMALFYLFTVQKIRGKVHPINMSLPATASTVYFIIVFL
ncbi:MAG: hypothetical protein WC756_11565 [Taibaiella sp.]|jgi:hypothetical protein